MGYFDPERLFPYNGGMLNFKPALLFLMILTLGFGCVPEQQAPKKNAKVASAPDDNTSAKDQTNNDQNQEDQQNQSNQDQAQNQQQEEGQQDQGSQDQGSQDQGSQDQGSQDQGSQDQGSQDQGSQDQGSQDQGSQDQGSQDQGSQDQGSQDQGSQDQGSQDQGSQDQGSQDQGSSEKQVSHILFNRMDNRHLQWIEVPLSHTALPNYSAPSGGVFDLSQAISAWSSVGNGTDRRAAMSGDGKTIIIESERSCANGSVNACYLVLEMSGQTILSVGHIGDLSNWNRNFGQGSALDHNGLNFVIPLRHNGGYQLFRYQRASKLASWQGPTLLSSSFSQNSRPTFSKDGQKIVFECNSEAYVRQRFCQINLDGSGYKVILEASHFASLGGQVENLEDPVLFSNGDLAFELEYRGGSNSSYQGERIWKVSFNQQGAAQAPVLINSDYGNDNSPVILSDDRIASFWLNRQGNSSGNHEVKIMDKDGANGFVLTNFESYDESMTAGQ